MTELSIADGRLLSPSPDGTLLAVIDGDGRLCVLRLPTLDEVSCGDFPSGHEGNIDGQAVSWSPDSALLAFHENLFLAAEESDIWTMDVASGAFRNLTEDGQSGNIIGITGRPNIDLIPTWSADGGQLAFARSPRFGGGATELWSMAADGSQPPTTLGPISQDALVMVYGAHWLPDGQRIVFTLFTTDPVADRGIWIVDTTGGTPRQLLGPDEERGAPSLAGLSADGTLAVVMYREVLQRRVPGTGAYELLGLEDGQVRPVGPPAAGTDPPDVRGAALFPDGGRLAYTDRAGQSSRLFVGDLAGASEQVLVERPEPMGDLDIGYQLAWPTPNVLYVPSTPDSAFLVTLAPE